MQSLSDVSVQFVKGVGPGRKKIFERLGIETVEDLLYFFPRRYEDRRQLTPIAELNLGEFQTISGKIITQSANQTWYTKKHVTKIILEDDTGAIVCTWFNQSYLKTYLRAGKRLVCYGKVDAYKKQRQMIAPEYEIIAEDGDSGLSIDCIVPIYALTRGMTQRYLRKVIKFCLDKFKDQLIDELPVSLRNKYKIVNIKRSILNIHFPDDFKDQENAIKRVSFEEFYFFQISIILRRLSIIRKKGVVHQITDEQVLKFVGAFPFELTGAQKKVVCGIRGDMQKVSPMLRLLQGDVGSGKTLVALFGCVMAIANGKQACVMAPTSILARQHYENIVKMLREEFPEIKVALLVGSLTKSVKDKVTEQIKNGEVQLIIGTHALISEQVVFKNLSFVVIDEQHKFGVRQRALLAKKGTNPDVLIMTATPIPRTLCITLYGDLDISIIDEMPPGRGKVKTFFRTEDQAQDVYVKIRAKVEKNKVQVYIVYPIIEESQKLDLKAAKVMFKRLETCEFKGLRLGLIHGRLKPKESREIMRKFKDKEIDVLVATTVVEVGVDVPNANVMIIEHAERFGLSQLHQLRGRIGRGKEDGICILIGNPQTSEGQARLKAICSTHDGFKIAQHDLEIRGPGRFFGRHQHGLNELKVANPAKQIDLLELARKEAIELTTKDPELKNGTENPRIKSVIRRRYPTYLSMVEAG